MSKKNQDKSTRTIRCTVVSDKMQKTRVGRVDRLVKDPLVGKYMRRSTRIKFHDENNETRIGDEVFIAECKPMSRHKAYSFVSVISKAKE